MAAKKRKTSEFRAKAARKARKRKREALLARTRTLNASRVRLNQGGYDSRGKYFGHGMPVYRIDTNDKAGDKGDWVHGYVRARSSQEAKEEAVTRPHHWGIRNY